MKRTSLIRILMLLIMVLVLGGCKNQSGNEPSEPQIITEAPVQTPSEAATPSAEPTPSAPSAEAAEAVTPSAEPTPPAASAEASETPAPTEAPAPTPPYASASAPTITKDPTGETVNAGGSAMFIARCDDATRAIWHFVSPDFSQDLEYTEAARVFDGLDIIDGDTGTLVLQNIPESLNGWRVYCHFSNAVGSADTGRAAITVNAATLPEPIVFDYTGTFTEARASRGTMTITGSPSLYEVCVVWHEGTMEYITKFSGVFSDTGIMSYNNAELTVHFDDGSHELRYTGGTGSLAYVDSGVVGVYWTDNQSEYDEDNFFFAKDR